MVVSKANWQDLVISKFEHALGSTYKSHREKDCLEMVGNLGTIIVTDLDSTYQIELIKCVGGVTVHKILEEDYVGELTTAIAGGWENKDGWEVM